MNVEQLEKSPWFQELLHLVQEELDRNQRDDSRDRPNRRHDLDQVRDRMAGLRESLANPRLAASVRQYLEADLGNLLDREAVLQQQLQAEEQRPQTARELVDPKDIVNRLERLHEVLRSGNASEINVELSHYIDRIECSADGQMRLRICPFGMAPAALSVAPAAKPTGLDTPEPVAPGILRGKPRRRAIRRVEDRNAAHFVADPDRFRGLPDEWFWIDVFRQPERKSWAEAHSDEVYAARFNADGSVRATYEQLEKRFGRTKPTLRSAVAIAKKRRHQVGASSENDAA